MNELLHISMQKFSKVWVNVNFTQQSGLLLPGVVMTALILLRLTPKFISIRRNDPSAQFKRGTNLT